MANLLLSHCLLSYFTFCQKHRMTHIQNGPELFVTPFGTHWMYMGMLYLLYDGFVLEKT